MKVVASWSGGKDSAYAYYLATQQGHQVINLLTMMMSEEKSNFHMIPSGILDAQAQAIGVPLIKKTTSAATYEKDFKTALLECKARGAEGLVTGDIYEVAGHEEGWLGRVCKEVSLTPVKPLWMGDTKKIYLDYLKTGFKATVVRTKLELLGVEWLGRVLDRQFYDDILKLGNVDACARDPRLDPHQQQERVGRDTVRHAERPVDHLGKEAHPDEGQHPEHRVQDCVHAGEGIQFSL